jgi:hypothetical protein
LTKSTNFGTTTTKPKTAAAPSTPEQITNGGGSDPFDSTDGKTLYYVRGQGDLWSTPAEGGKPSRVLSSGVHGGWFAVSTRGIFFADLYPGGGPALFVPRSAKPIDYLHTAAADRSTPG